MKVGDLVKITRHAIGVPRDTIGIITQSQISDAAKTHVVLMFVNRVGYPRERRWLARDLEVIQ
jgi:hypothetical protein